MTSLHLVDEALSLAVLPRAGAHRRLDREADAVFGALGGVVDGVTIRGLTPSSS